MTDETNNATSRVPVTPANHLRLKDFRSGLNGSFDDAIALLLHLVMKPGEDEFSAGKRLRDDLETMKRSALGNSRV